ncbi:MAG: hypothetical protein IPO56_16665 [Flavobacteriales bacterium]|nr:hypothetical protein [Flavobacteriales bacterium]
MFNALNRKWLRLLLQRIEFGGLQLVLQQQQLRALLPHLPIGLHIHEDDQQKPVFHETLQHTTRQVEQNIAYRIV